MEISKLIFTKETKDKMGKELNKMQRGRLRWEKLKQAEEEGKLMLAKNRHEVANLAGFMPSEKERGYQWVSRLIGRGQMKETVYGIGENGLVEHEYKLVGRPDYEHKNANEARWGKPVSTTPISSSEKGLNCTQRGALRWEKIKDAERRGELALAKNRYQVARLVGFTHEQRVRGYGWVTNMVLRGHLREVETGIDKNKHSEYRYSVIRDPDYSRSKARGVMLENKRKAKETPAVVETNVSINTDANEGRVYKLEFSNGATTIKLELDDYEKVAELIKTILKGE